MTYKKIVSSLNTYYVSQSDSYAAIAGKLYYNGTLAADGTYTLNLDDSSEITIMVESGVTA